MTTRWTSTHRPTTDGSFASGWNDGYMVDTVYMPQMVSELSPTWLSMVSVLNGQPPLRRVPGRPLRWLDLGCGLGTSTAMVAAANDDVEVWGVDFNPAHVDVARHFAANAGLDKCRFIEASFADIASDTGLGPDEVDVVVVNGVYSWISAANQRQIAEVIRRRLRPGGFAFVMYEVPLGWASLSPVTEALRLHASTGRRRPEQAFAAAAEALRDLAEQGARYFPLPSTEAKRMESWAGADGFYAAHEYLGSNFGPLMFDQVARTMADARCSFIGTTPALSAFQFNWMPDELREMFQSVDDVVLREMLHDVFGERALRSDLYRRGLVPVTGGEYAEWTKTLEIAGLGRDLEDKPIELLVGGVTLDPAFHQPLLDALASGPLDVEAILAIHDEWTRRDAVIAMALLVGGGYAAPSVPGKPSAEVRERCRRVNEVLFAEFGHGIGHSYLVAPKLGTSMGLDSVELRALSRLKDRGSGQVQPTVEHVTDSVMGDLAEMGHQVREDNKLVTDPDEARTVVHKRVERAFRLHTTVLPSLGVEV